MHFVLFIPEDDSQSVADALTGVGCGHLVEGAQAPQTLVNGPDGKRGKVYSWMTNSGQVHRYEPDEWIPAVANLDADLESARYWVGFKSVSPPKPIDLLRAYPYSGEKVFMGDQQQWLMPRAMSLPHDAIRADDGSTRFIPQRKFHSFVNLADEWRNSFNAAKHGTRFIFDEMRDFVELGLIANYRILPEVADYLRMYTTGTSGSVQPALLAAIAIVTPETMEG